jgi:tRNA(Ile)-lysidine synthase
MKGCRRVAAAFSYVWIWGGAAVDKQYNSRRKEQRAMIAKVYQYMESQHMIAPGQRILAAVSGGADSMCLLQVLLELQKQMQAQAQKEMQQLPPQEKQVDFMVRVLHVHHGLRESAEGDLQYVKQFCERAGIPFQAVRVDAARYAAENGMSVEEAARHLRYEALEKAAAAWDAEAAKQGATAYEGDQAAEEWDAEVRKQTKMGNSQTQCRIAVAHHIEDQAETVLFHLVRGSRLTGLRGMLPVNGRIIRPLMCCSREEIEDFLKERGIVWREDETNEDVRYARNLLRKQVMPLLLTINEGAKEHIARAAEEVAEAEQYLAGETERALQRCLVRSDVGRKTVQIDAGRRLVQEKIITLHIPTLLAEPPLLQRRVVYAAIAEAAGRKKDLHDIHVQAVLHLCRKQGNGQLDVAGGVHVRKVYENLLFEPGVNALARLPAQPIAQKSAQPIAQKPIQPIAQKSPQPTAHNQALFPTRPEAYTYRVFDFDGDMGTVPRKQCTKWLDYGKIGELLSFRTRRVGDYITLDESGRTKSIARYMIDQKVPAQWRDQIVMPACGDEILWVPGGRISAAYMVTADTKKILEIHWTQVEEPLH